MNIEILTNENGKRSVNYRPAVGAAIFNKDGHIWLGKRYGQNGLFRLANAAGRY